MSKFKFGDRVRVYGYDHEGLHLYDGERGKVLCEPDGIGMLQVRVDGELDGSSVHEKQCRKLVKKARREFWLRLDKDGTPRAATDGRYPPATLDHTELVRVREVRAKR